MFIREFPIELSVDSISNIDYRLIKNIDTSQTSTFIEVLMSQL